MNIHPQCYSMCSWNHVGVLDGHYTVLLERPSLETFTFYKFGGYGSLNWFPEVPFEVPEFSVETVDAMSEAIVKDVRRQHYYHGEPYGESILAWGENKNIDIQKRWGTLPKFPTPAAVTKYADKINENVTIYATFGDKTHNLKMTGNAGTTVFRQLRQLLKQAAAEGLTYKGRGSFDLWLDSLRVQPV